MTPVHGLTADPSFSDPDRAGAMRRLPVGWRAVIVLRFLVGADEQETAAILRIPLGTVTAE